MNLLAKIVPGGPGGVGKLVLPLTTDTAIELYPVNANAGTTGTGLYVRAGDAQCIMDNTTSGKAGTYILASTSTPGRCHQQDTAPATGMVIGKLLSDSTTAGQPARIDVQNINYSPGNVTGTGTVTSVTLNMPAEYSVATANQTTTPTFTVTKASQSANLFYAAPVGTAGSPGFRTIQQPDVAGLSLPPGGAAGGDLGGTYPNLVTVLQSSTTFALSGTTAISTGSSLANYGGCPTNTCHMTTTSANLTVSGFQAPTIAGDLKHVCNVGSNAFTLLNESSTSTATNQLRLTTNSDTVADDVTLAPWHCLTLRYAGSPISRWMPLSQAVPDYLRYRSIGVIVGDPETNSPTLVPGNNTPNGITNDLGRPLRILDLACRADQGSSSIDVRQAGQATSLLTGACTCNSTGWTACTLNATAANVTLSTFNPAQTCTGTFCAVDVITTTTDNQTKYYTLKGKAILQ